MNISEYSKKLTNLKPAREVFVAFLDILGFSEFVCKNTHADLTAIYQSYFRPMIDFSLTEIAEQSIEDSSWLKDVETPEIKNDIAPKLDNVLLNCLTISDSIVISTTNNQFIDFMRLVATVRNIMAKSLYFGFPLRGAIAHGMLTWDSDMSKSSNIIHQQMLGLPIIEANRLEKEQNWSGCAIHSSVIDKVGPKLIRLEPMMLTLYDIPIKQKNKELLKSVIKQMYAVNWVQGIADNDKSIVNACKIREAFSSHGKEVNSTVEEIILNTITFFNKMSAHPVYRNEMTNEEWWSLVENEFND